MKDMVKETLSNTDYERGGTQKDFYTESDVKFINCPLCGTNQYKEIYKERGALGIVSCLSCGLIYINPQLKTPETVYWGDADKYFKEARLIFEGKARHHRDTNYLDDLRMIYRYKPYGNFLDVGTNMGFFLRNAKGWEWNLYGVEPSPSLSEMARKYFNLNVKTAFLEDAGFEGEFFDAVAMTDVFEHIPQPTKLLNEIRRILKSDGVLFIKVPNGLFNLFKFYIAKMTGRLKKYDIFDSYEHVIHYSDRTLHRILEKCGFAVIRTYIGKPIQLPVWHKYVGHFYQYPSPWILDPVRQSLRVIFYWLSFLEFWIRFKKAGYLAPNFVIIAKKV
ncbi:MAG: class I SAM-dependent methyltransferase [Candidatus Omnitrophica bacterium]|nr:class I SAM-dependent methyltransferase [Candidatus Omnitrophota bacterium]